MRMLASPHCVTALLLPLALGLLTGCPLVAPDSVSTNDFLSVSENGFEKADNARDLNNYPWAMRWFQPTGSETGHLYVSTGNSIINIILLRVGVNLSIDPVYRAPEIRRYRPDLGTKVWERVLDYHDIDTGPDPATTGIRAMAVYEPPGADRAYLYAGTLGRQINLWRTATGEPGAWELVWTLPEEGSIRWLQPHNGLMYIAITHEFQTPPTPAGKLYATDGQSVWLVSGDGFGNPNNGGVFSLASFNGWLYAGTLNQVEGFEVWKLDGPDGQAGPVRVVSGGGASPGNMATSEMCVFRDHLYVPAMIFIGLKTEGGLGPRGADLIRLDRADNVEVIVGPGSLGGIESGFGTATNSYLWSMVEHQGRLYCGTWDSNAVLPILGFYLGDILRSGKLTLYKLRGGQPYRDWYDILTNKGCELWASDDGVAWTPVFTDGLGNPDHYGVRTMASVGEYLYLGLSNVLDGLEIFRTRDGVLAPVGE